MWGVAALADQAQGIVEVWLNTQEITVRFAARILAIDIPGLGLLPGYATACVRHIH